MCVIYTHTSICACVYIYSHSPTPKPELILEDSKQETVYLCSFRRNVANWTLPGAGVGVGGDSFSNVSLEQSQRHIFLWPQVLCALRLVVYRKWAAWVGCLHFK